MVIVRRGMTSGCGFLIAARPSRTYAWRHGRRHPHPERHRAGRPEGRRRVAPARLRRAAEARRRPAGPRRPGQTLQATALVHEAYLRLVDGERPQQWDGRGHFFAAAAEAMRRILVEAARRKGRIRHGGGLARHARRWDLAAPEPPERVLALDEALDQLAVTNPQAAELVKLRYFAGLSIAEAAEALGVSPRKADQVWAYARAWLEEELGE